MYSLFRRFYNMRGEEKNITLYDNKLNKLALKKNDEIRKNNRNRKKPDKSQIKEKTKTEGKKTNIKEKDWINHLVLTKKI